jgi:hypothetical protein
VAVQLRIREEDEPIVGTSRKIQKKTAQKDAAQKVLAKLEVKHSNPYTRSCILS